MAAKGGQPAGVLVVDVRTLLDESAEGKRAAAALEASFHEHKHKRDALDEGEDVRRFEAEAVATLEGERARLREALLARARAVIEEVRRERDAAVVVDRALTLAAADAVDVTAEVLARLDAA